MKRYELHQVENFIGNFLRYGVLACAAVIAVGIAMSFLLPGNLHPPLADFLAEVMTGKLVEVPLFTTLANPNSVISVGLLMLIALPILRVALTLIVFIVERDSIYIVITAIVLGVLLTGLFFGKEL